MPMISSKERYKQFRCNGTQKNGHPCRRLLFEYNPKVDTDIEIVCPKCGSRLTLIRRRLDRGT